MKDPYLELKIEETRVQNIFWKFIWRDCLNGIEFKDGYHTSNLRNTNDFTEEMTTNITPSSFLTSTFHADLREFSKGEGWVLGRGD